MLEEVEYEVRRRYYQSSSTLTLRIAPVEIAFYALNRFLIETTGVKAVRLPKENLFSDISAVGKITIKVALSKPPNHIKREMGFFYCTKKYSKCKVFDVPSVLLEFTRTRKNGENISFLKMKEGNMKASSKKDDTEILKTSRLEKLKSRKL